MGAADTRAYGRPRAYIAVRGPEAANLLQRIVSNDVLTGDVCEALILTAKGRVIAPLVVWRRSDDDFLLLTEPELGEVVRAHLERLRIAAKCEIAFEEHRSAIVFGDVEGIPTRDYGVPAVEQLDNGAVADAPDEELERLRSWPRRRAGGERSTTRFSLPRRGSTSARSRLRRAATRVRSRSRGCARAVT